MPKRLSDFRATDFEFRARFWIIGGVFWLGFALYAAGDINSSLSVARWLAGAGSPQVSSYSRVILGLGTALAAAAALIRSWAEAYLHSSVVHDAKMHSDQLTADGPYRYVRNPLYLGTVLLALGLGTMASRFGFAIVVAGIPVIVYRLILREEAGLLASQGERYREYFRAVPRLIPALHPRVPFGEARPRLGGRVHGGSVHVGHSLRHGSVHPYPAPGLLVCHRWRRLRSLRSPGREAERPVASSRPPIADPVIPFGTPAVLRRNFIQIGNGM